MAVRERLRQSPLARAPERDLSEHLIERITRGRQHLQSSAPSRDECYEFFRGQHYAYVDEKNVLRWLPTVTTARGKGKPDHRARQKRNLIFDIVLREAAAGVSQIPSYQVVPSTGDPQDRSAAALSEQVLLWGYGKWGIRQAAVDAIIHAVIGGESFAWPFFDNQVGPFFEGESFGEGDVRIAIFGANECYWEPGLRFEDSPWHVVEQAVPEDQVKRMPGYEGPDELNADAATRAMSKKKSPKLILRANYLERPCADYPKGRWLVIANKQRIVPEQDYPGTGQDSVLRKLSYAPDPDSDRDIGLVPQLLDPQRTKNDVVNKQVETKNHTIFPRIFVTPGLMKKQRWTGEPGKVYEIPQPEQNVKVIETPPINQSLFEMEDRATADMGRIAAQNDLPTGAESGKAIAAAREIDQSRKSLFIGELAKWYADIGHDCLVLVAEKYNEDRLVQLKGDFGWESISDFRGAKLRDQTDVRVLPESIEPITRQAQEQKIMNYVQMGAVPPERAVAALEFGTADLVTRSLALDESRAARIIQRIKNGTIWDQLPIPTGRMVPDPEAMIPDPATGEPVPDPAAPMVPEMAPWWMPRHSDNIPIFKQNFADWLKTEDYERLEPDLQIAAVQVYAAIQQLEAEKAAEAQAAQMAQAEQLGLDNAAKPQRQKPLPSLPAVNGDGQQESRSGP